MKEVMKNGVHVDVCTQCRGVWLDRGELDKLMASVQRCAEDFYQQPVNAEYVPPRSSVERGDNRGYYREDHVKEYSYHKHPKHRKKSALESVFDIFD